jgi:signal transduction histidine kinase
VTGRSPGKRDLSNLPRDLLPVVQDEDMADQGDQLSDDARALLDAVTAMSSDLDLHNVLDRIVASACALTGARYGALGIIGGSGLSDFITHGVDETTRARIGDPPHGRGILGLLIRHPSPLRLEHLQQHPDSYGFPANHPPMASFIGMPVLIRGTVFGNLYLTEKDGGVPFTLEDQHLLQALATAAGYVIENARAYALSERQRAWLETTTRLNDSLRPGIDLREAMRLVAVGTRMVSNAQAVAMIEVHGDGGDHTILASEGRDADVLGDLTETLRDEIEAAALGAQADPIPLPGARLALALPVRAHLVGSLVMLVVLDNDNETHDLGMERKELDLVASFADQAALALDRVQALGEREQLAIVSDRDRIARDLHDLVIQRLFATGLQLQGVRAQVVSAVVGERIDQAVSDLDATIRDIRTTIFQLQQPARATLRTAVTDLGREYAEVLGFHPRVRTDGPVDTLVPPAMGEHLLAVLREALSNAARHASASHVEVDVEAAQGRLLLRVTDDGIGIGAPRHESGLQNVRRRAEALKGVVRIHDASPNGTVLEWVVPLPD